MNHRKLVMQVGGGTTFSPTNLSGLQLWFDASDASTISIVTGVSQWRDKSGNANHASQATGAKQPTVASAALNGKDTLAFAGASQQIFDLTTVITAVTATDAWSVFAIGKRAAASQYVAPLGSTDGAQNSCFPLLLNIDGKFYGASSSKVSTSSIAYNNSTLYHKMAVLHRTDDTFDLFFDGAQITETESAGARRPNWGQVGGALGASDAYTNGNIAEILYYNKLLTTNEVANISAYFQNKWGI